MWGKGGGGGGKLSYLIKVFFSIQSIHVLSRRDIEGTFAEVAFTDQEQQPPSPTPEWPARASVSVKADVVRDLLDLS